MPPKVRQSNAKHYKSDTITEIVEYDSPHLIPSQAGWEEIADYALDWAVEEGGDLVCAGGSNPGVTDLEDHGTSAGRPS